MSKNLPAIRYELFVKAFEKRVTAAQREIERLRTMEQPYNVVKDAMEAARLPNQQDITMTAGEIGVRIIATPADSLAAFEAVAERVGKRLHDAGLHRDGVPATNHGGIALCLWFTWACCIQKINRHFTARIYVGLPIDGLTDCDVIETVRTVPETEYQIRRKQPPAYAAPPNFTNARPTAAELARMEVELGVAEREEEPS